MSYRLRSLILLLLCTLILFVSCSKSGFGGARAFENSFCAVVTVTDGEYEYRAEIRLSGLGAVDTSVDNERRPRDGSIIFLSPDNVSDITARRSEGVVTIGVSGVEITPSPSIADRYVTLLDVLDIRSIDLGSVSERDENGRRVSEARFVSDDKAITVLFDSETLLPISLANESIILSFDEFAYT